MVQIIEATSNKDYQTAAQLFKEYHLMIGIDLEFQNFSQEIENIKIQYSRPEGAIFIIHQNEKSALGCFGVRKLNDTVCELKRMYLKTEARGMGIGRIMLEKALQFAKEMGYKKMRLDTLSTMYSAISLYQKMGFYEIGPYRYNPFEGAKYFEIRLDR